MRPTAAPKLVAPKLATPKFVAPKLVAPKLVTPKLVAPKRVAPKPVVRSVSEMRRLNALFKSGFIRNFQWIICHCVREPILGVLA